MKTQKLWISLAITLCFSISCTNDMRRTKETIEHPPFTIVKRTKKKSRFDWNTNQRRDDTRTTYQVYYNGSDVEYPDAIEENTGVSGIWKVYILEDAPKPTLLIVSQAAFLLTEDNGASNIITLKKPNQSFVSLQWLDEINGQPGEKWEVYSSNDKEQNCNLSGGKFLLIDGHIILNVTDLSIRSFQRNYDQTNGYSPNSLLGFSPDQNQIVFMGYNSQAHYEQALLSYNIQTNQAHTIPIDRTETRLHEPYQATSDWLNTYFEWQKQEDGLLQLTKRQLDNPPLWNGHFEKGGNYALSPVKEELRDIFAEFIRQHFQLSEDQLRVKTFENDTSYSITIDKYEYKLSYLDDLQSVYFSTYFGEKDEEGNKVVLQKIGEAFNEELLQGKHQEYFTSYME